MSVKTYDVKCYELAEHFLQDEPARKDPEMYKKLCDDLAKEIQQTVEDWFLMDVDAVAMSSTDQRHSEIVEGKQS